MNADRAPIAVFAYKRWRHLRLTLESLQRCDDFSEHPVTIYCDAARRPSDQANVDRTRAVADAWSKEHGAKLVARSSNLGFDNIISGISEMCEAFGRTIVVEDDIVVSRDFLSYMDAALDRYQNVHQVYSVSGYMYAEPALSELGCFFLPVVFIWGWGTWDRAWRRYTARPDDWQEVLADASMRQRFDLDGALPYSAMLNDVMTGRLTTWDVQWSYCHFRDGALALHPPRSLTWNTGVGCGVNGLLKRDVIDHRVDFIHGNESRNMFDAHRLPQPFPLPDRVEVNKQALTLLSRSLRSAHTPLRRARRMLARATDLLWRQAFSYANRY